ncbi:MAG: TolC family protein, partial [Rubrivivax sp.]
MAALGADAAQARAWQNPRIDALAENLSARSQGGASPRQTTFAVSQPLELFGKRGARLDVADRNLGAATARSRQVQVVFAADLALAYATAEASTRRSALAADEVNRATDDLRVATTLVDAGREASLRSAQARASLAAAQAAESAAQADAVQALQTLAALAGSATAFTGITGTLLDAQPVPMAQAEVTESPAVLAARADRDALQAVVEVERRRSLPDVAVTAGVRSYAFSGTPGYQVGLSMSVPLFDRNTGGVEA